MTSTYRMLPWIALCLAVLLGASPRPTRPTILFLRYAFGPSEMLLMDADGSNVRPVTDAPHSVGLADWSPDGTEIVYAGSRFAGLRIMNFATGVERSVSVPAEAYGLNHVRWSPDGSRVVFRAWTGNPEQMDVFVLDLEEGALRNLSQHPRFDRHPTWSPDGTQIAFDSERVPPFAPEDIFIVDAQGGAPVNVTRTKRREYHPDWSPDGTSIAFVRSHELTLDGELWILDLRSGRDRLIETPTGISVPSWTPDGQRLLLITINKAGDRTDIAVVDVDGENFRFLTDTPGPHEDAAHMFDPDVWGISPLGRLVETWGGLKAPPDSDLR